MVEYYFDDVVYMFAPQEFVDELRELLVLAKLLDYNIIQTTANCDGEFDFNEIPLIIFRKRNSITFHLNFFTKNKQLISTSTHESPSDGRIYVDLNDTHYALKKLKEML